MISGKYVAPALIFFTGAVLGRVFGLKPLVRGAMTVANMAGLAEAPSPGRTPSTRRIAHHPRKRPARRRVRAA
jgi:hypothetical protein